MNDPAKTAPVPPVERSYAPPAADERSMLAAYLDWNRATLQHKCAGLSPEELAQESCPPSNLSLFGLLRHLTDVERGWFTRGAGRDAAPLYYSDEDPEGDIEIRGPVTAEQVRDVLRAWHAECDRSRAVIADVSSLDDAAAGGTKTWRWILLHMIEEYARHNGHADLIREAIDGATGS